MWENCLDLNKEYLFLVVTNSHEVVIMIKYILNYKTFCLLEVKKLFRNKFIGGMRKYEYGSCFSKPNTKSPDSLFSK
jgi:hypothetical protein